MLLDLIARHMGCTDLTSATHHRGVGYIVASGTAIARGPRAALRVEVDVSREQRQGVIVMVGYVSNKEDYLKRLRRIEGQVRGLQRMVSEDAYCIEVLTQVSAATKALQSVALGLLDEHLSHCVVEAAAAGGQEADVKVREASDAIARLVRS
jgi:CsoR family transcriptional regulator, copper-sensing transcriptional repressor